MSSSEKTRKYIFQRLKNVINGSPLERYARRVFLRLDHSVGGKCERYILPILKSYLKQNSNCIDIGAHRGTILEEIVALAPYGSHYAFEPIPSHCKYLRKQYPAVNVFQLALSNNEGERQFIHVLGQSTRSGFLHPPGIEDQIETIYIQTDLLDHIIPQNFIVDFIKIDVEGAELEVLQGSSNTIRQNNPLIFFEHSAQTSSLYGTKSHDMYRLLVDNYDMKIWSPSGWLHHEDPMSINSFIETVGVGEIVNFIAHR